MSEDHVYFIKGDKVGLRGFEHADLNVLKEWLKDADATYYLEMAFRPYSEQNLEAVYKDACENPNAVVFAVCDLETGQPIGTAGLYLITWTCRRAQYRIFIGESDYIGKGYGSEVNKLVAQYGFEKLNLHNIYLGVNAENEGAIKSYKNVGYVEEGRQRDFIFNNGRYYDCIAMSLLSHEFKA